MCTQQLRSTEIGNDMQYAYTAKGGALGVFSLYDGVKAHAFVSFDSEHKSKSMSNSLTQNFFG